MKKERKQYAKEFKLMVVELCKQGKSNTEVAIELGLRPEMVSRWNREYKKKEKGSFSGHGNRNLTDHEREIYELKKQLREVEIERDILKKAVGIFSRKDGKYTHT